MNEQVEGKEYPPLRFVVDPERVAAFARAIDAPDDGVPPTFVTAIEFTGFPAIMADPELGIDFSRVVHSEQIYEFSRPLRVGETVVATARLASIRHKGGHGFCAIETRVVDEEGAEVVTARATLLERGAG